MSLAHRKKSKIDGEPRCFLIRFAVLTSNHVYSVVCNQSLGRHTYSGGLPK